MNLTVGRLSSNIEDSVAAALRRRKLAYADEWRSCPENMVSIDIFNLATLDVFHQHIFRLDSLPNEETSIARTRFRHLPFYVFDVWLPVEFDPTPEPELIDVDCPIPLLSCQRLLQDLEEIKRASDITLGIKPTGYDLMRDNPREFYRSNIMLGDESAMVQWIWRGLYDAAELAIGNSAPLFAAE